MVEAAEQCGRTALPGVADPVKLAALLRDWPTDRVLFFADETGGAPALDAMRACPGPAAILIGPEGGFDDDERAAIRAMPAATAIALGPRILRADTRRGGGRAVDGRGGGLVTPHPIAAPVSLRRGVGYDGA